MKKLDNPTLKVEYKITPEILKSFYYQVNLIMFIIYGVVVVGGITICAVFYSDTTLLFIALIVLFGASSVVRWVKSYKRTTNISPEVAAKTLVFAADDELMSPDYEAGKYIVSWLSVYSMKVTKNLVILRHGREQNIVLLPLASVGEKDLEFIKSRYNAKLKKKA